MRIDVELVLDHGQWKLLAGVASAAVVRGAAARPEGHTPSCWAMTVLSAKDAADAIQERPVAAPVTLDYHKWLCLSTTIARLYVLIRDDPKCRSNPDPNNVLNAWCLLHDKLEAHPGVAEIRRMSEELAAAERAKAKAERALVRATARARNLAHRLSTGRFEE